jgi:hypothetical protein
MIEFTPHYDVVYAGNSWVSGVVVLEPAGL